MAKCRYYEEKEIIIDLNEARPTRSKVFKPSTEKTCEHPYFKKLFSSNETVPINCTGNFPDKCILPNTTKYTK